MELKLRVILAATWPMHRIQVQTLRERQRSQARDFKLVQSAHLLPHCEHGDGIADSESPDNKPQEPDCLPSVGHNKSECKQSQPTVTSIRTESKPTAESQSNTQRGSDDPQIIRFGIRSLI